MSNCMCMSNCTWQQKAFYSLGPIYMVVNHVISPRLDWFVCAIILLNGNMGWKVRKRGPAEALQKVPPPLPMWMHKHSQTMHSEQLGHVGFKCLHDHNNSSGTFQRTPVWQFCLTFYLQIAGHCYKILLVILSKSLKGKVNFFENQIQFVHHQDAIPAV